MGANDVETGFGKRFATYAQGVERGIVLGEKHGVAGLECRHGGGGVKSAEACGLQALTQRLHGQKIDR